MRRITRTVYGSKIQTDLLLRLPYTQVANSTLNEKFAIQSGVVPPNNDYPMMRYFCIGNGGHKNATGADGVDYTTTRQHRASDAALFSHLPFLLREVGDDLDNTTRAKYALRKIITVSGEEYIAYYLKRIPMDGVVTQMKNNVVVDGVVNTTAFVPTSANLNPIPPNISNTGVNTTTGDFLSVAASLGLDFTANDVAELVNVCQILFNNEFYAIVSEIGLVAGADKLVTETAGVGTSFNYQECVAATITTFLTGHFPVGYTNEGFNYTLDLGATEPLFGLADI